jgi:hypothetical protein
MLAVTLASMENDAQAATADWLRLMAEELGNDTVDAQAIIKFGAAPLVAKLSRLGALFKMARRRAEEIMVEAGGDASLIECMELQSGFNFRESSVPASADIIVSVTADTTDAGLGFSKKRNPRNNFKRTPTTVPTLSEVLEYEGTLLDQVVPEHCYALITTYEPNRNPIDSIEESAFTDAVLAHYGEGQMRFNLGRPLCRLLGKQIERRLVLGTRGKVDGTLRKWHSILYEKCKNRYYAQTSA